MLTGQLQTPTIVRYPGGDHWLVSLDQNRQLILRPLDEREEYQAGADCLPAPHDSNWVATVDEKGMLHGISTGKHSLHYWHGQPGSWDEQVLLTLNGNMSGETVPLFLGCRSNTLHLVYLNRNPLATEWFLCYRKWSDHLQSWSKPTILAQAADNGNQPQPTYWAMDMDRNGMLHLLYVQPDVDGHRIYHRSLTPGDGAGRTSLICGSAAPEIPPDLVVDQKGNVHLTWVDSNTNDLKYRQYKQGGWPGGGWMAERSINAWAPDHRFPLLQVQEPIVVAAWQQSDQVYGCLSHNLGMHWEPSFSLNGLPETLPVRYTAIPAPGEMTAHWSFCTETQPVKLTTPVHFLLPSLLQPEQSDLPELPETPTVEPVAPNTRHEEHQGDLSFFIEQHNDYFQRLIQQTEDLKQANAQIDSALEEKIRELNAVTSLSRQAEARARSLSQQLLSQNETLKMMEANIQRLIAERSRLTADCQKLHQQVELLKEEIQTHVARQKDIEAELVNHQRISNEKDAEVADCRQSLQEKDREAAIQTRQLIEREQMIASLEKQLSGVQELYQQAQQKLAEKKPGILERLSKVIQ